MSFPERSAEVLVQAMLIIETKLIDKGIDNKKAAEAAEEAVDALRKDFGGDQFYWPRDTGLDQLLKQHVVYKHFTGNNHRELAKKFDYSTTHVYRIIKKITEQERKRRQPELF